MRVSGNPIQRHFGIALIASIQICDGAPSTLASVPVLTGPSAWSRRQTAPGGKFRGPSLAEEKQGRPGSEGTSTVRPSSPNSRQSLSRNRHGPSANGELPPSRDPDTSSICQARGQAAATNQSSSTFGSRSPKVTKRADASAARRRPLYLPPTLTTTGHEKRASFAVLGVPVCIRLSDGQADRRRRSKRHVACCGPI